MNGPQLGELWFRGQGQLQLQQEDMRDSAPHTQVVPDQSPTDAFAAICHEVSSLDDGSGWDF